MSEQQHGSKSLSGEQVVGSTSGSRAAGTDDVERPVSLPSISVRGALDTLWRYRRRSTMFFAGAMALIIVGLIFCPRKYMSDAKLFVRIGRESVALDPTVTTGQIMGVETSREPEINSLLEVIMSRQVMERVVDEAGLSAPGAAPIARERAITRLQKSIEVWSPKQSNVIGVAYEAESPQKAQKVVDTLIDTVRAEHSRVNSTPGSYEFFEEQTADTKAELDAALAKLRDAKIEFGIGSVDGRRETLQKQIGVNEQNIIDNATELSAVHAKINKLQHSLGDLPHAVVRQFVKGLPADAENNMREQFYNLQTVEQELLAKYTENHPRVIAIREQVRGAEKILVSEKPDRGQATSAVLLSELATEKSFTARQDVLKKHAARLHRELDALNRHEVDIVELRRHVRLLEAKYATYNQNLEQARIDRELKKDEFTNISVIQPASLVLKPSSPRKGTTLVLGLMFSLGGAIALAFISDNFAKAMPVAGRAKDAQPVPTPPFATVAAAAATAESSSTGTSQVEETPALREARSGNRAAVVFSDGSYTNNPISPIR